MIQKTYKDMSKEEIEELLDKTYNLAYSYEQQYGSCSQCTYAAVHEIFGIGDKETFKSIYGMGAGIGLTSKGTCGALTAAILLAGSLEGRSYGDFDTGRNAECYATAKKILNQFKRKYGGVQCGEIQEKIMGNSFNLNIESESEAFEAAGGHEEKCPSVAGFAARIVAKMIVNGEIK
jgi:C_GCAxxG_C_C family probable redox protein